MKTTSYNAAKEMKIGILVLVFAMSIFTAVKVKELQLDGVNISNETRSEQILTNHTATQTSPVLDANLIEEPTREVNDWMNSIEYNAQKFVDAEFAIERERFLNSINEISEGKSTLQFESWMNIPVYKAEEFVNAEMAIENERFLNSDNEVADIEPAIQIEPWMNIPLYKAEEFVKTEMAIENERFLNNNNEVAKAEQAQPTESWMNTFEYKAAKYVEAEMASEIANWMKAESYWANNQTPKSETENSKGKSMLAFE